MGLALDLALRGLNPVRHRLSPLATWMRDRSVRTRDDYLSLRRRFEPDRTRLVIIGESPPASQLYFYDSEGLASEPLYSALTEHFGIARTNKAAGLSELKRQGVILLDATYQPVNEGLSRQERNQIILDHYLLLMTILKRSHAVIGRLFLSC